MPRQPTCRYRVTGTRGSEIGTSASSPAIVDPPIYGTIYPCWWTTFRGLFQLYNAFSNKDVVLQAMIRSLADQVVEDIAAGLEKANNLGEQLDVIFRHTVIEHYDLLQSSPNAEDILQA